MIRPITTEKAVRLIEVNNTLMFQVDINSDKKEIKKEIEDLFKIKIVDVKTLIRNNKKLAYVKLNKSNPAIDVATKLGLI